MRKSLILFACAMLCSCATSVSYSTKVLDHAAINPKRILVVESSGKDDSGNMNIFHSAIVDEFRSCSVVSDYVHLDLHEPSLSLDNDAAENSRRIEAALGRLNPDYLLTLREIHTNSSSPYDFKVELIDKAAKHTVWNGSAQLNFTGFVATGPKAGAVLAKTLVQQLQQADLLKSCPPLTEE